LLKLLVFMAMLGAPFTSSAQSLEALQAGMRQELNCLVNGALEAPANVTQAQSNQVLEDCRQRYGWDDPETVHAMLAARLSIEVMSERQQLGEAGVDFAPILRIWRSLTPEESASIRDATARPDDARQTSQAIVRRLLEAGVAPAHTVSAGGTIVKMVQAGSTAGEFIRLRVTRAGGTRQLNEQPPAQ